MSAERELNNDSEIGTVARIVSATAGAFATSLFVQPLDVLKTQLQLSTSPRQSTTQNIIVVSQICRNFGISGLFAGLRVTLFLNVPLNLAYYSTYDGLRNKLLETNYFKRNKNAQFLIYGISGCTARIFAATLVSPLELMRTQMMAHTLQDELSMWQAIQRNIGRNETIFSGHSILSLWKGLIPTLWRDVPFSVVYWIGYETIKNGLKMREIQTGQQQRRNGRNNGRNGLNNGNFRISFMSGVSSGVIATVVTHPFDVIKTQRQSTVGNISKNLIEIQKHTMVNYAQNIIKIRGIYGLFSGILPRLGRVPLACAIMVSTYELGKSYLQ